MQARVRDCSPTANRDGGIEEVVTMRQVRVVRGQAVQVRWNGAEWRDGTVERAYMFGADVIVGSAGCWYFTTDEIRGGA